MIKLFCLKATGHCGFKIPQSALLSIELVIPVCPNSLLFDCGFPIFYTSLFSSRASVRVEDLSPHSCLQQCY